MSEQTPRKGDKVRVTFDAEYVATDESFSVVDVADGMGPIHLQIPAWATVEVLERAVELCRATEGATGIECGLPRRHALDVDHEGTHDPTSAKHDGIGYRLTVRWPWNEWDRDAKAVGAEVPLPEWEREILEQEAARKAPEEYPLTMEQRQRVASLLVDGRKADAVAVLADAGWPHDLALREVESMPEWQTGRNHRPVEDAALPAEPRVFQWDGPEPPEDVTVLRDANAKENEMEYLVRAEGGWRWSPSREQVPPDCGPVQQWAEACGWATGDLREVV